MDRNEQARCFVALELPPEVKLALAGANEMLQRDVKAPVKWVDADSIHLTLKFLGNVPMGRLEELQSALRKACAETTAVRLQLASPGAFPRVDNPRVIWVGLKGDCEELGLLAERIEAAMAELGFPREARRFSPHLTLGRVREGATNDARHSITSALRSAEPVQAAAFEIAEVSLMRSHLSPNGARYTCLGRVALRPRRP